MTRTLIALLGVFILCGALVPAPAHAGGWSDSAYYDQARYGGGPIQGHGHGGSLFHFSPTTSKIAKVGLVAAGSIVSGILGSHFGVLGTVVGGAAGFFVSRWIGDKLFGQNGYPSLPGSNLFSKIRNRAGHDDAADDTQERSDRWSKIRSLNPFHGDDNLEGARRTFYTSMEDLKHTLASGTEADKAAAKAKYDQAREAYFNAKGQQH